MEVVKRCLASIIFVFLGNGKMGEGVSGSIGKLSFAFLPDLLGWRGGIRVHGASANSRRTASEHIV